MTRHLYIHIPFCRSRCAYCDFASEAIGAHTRAGRVNEYVAALLSEMRERAGGPAQTGGAVRAEEHGAAAAEGPADTRADTHARFATIYLGGGTPTVLPAELLLALVEESAARLAEGGELTIEANPGTIDIDLLRGLAEAGVTRLSLGVQSFSESGRRALGRRTLQREIADALRAITSTGWQEWSLDLVFGIPGQSRQEMGADIRAAVAAGPTHMSLYDLTYTNSYETWLASRLGPEAKERACMSSELHYAEAVAELEAAGYRRYEVSNFALPGHECRHNLAYWQGEDYLGLGASAVSTVGGERRTNPRRVVDYLAGLAPDVESLAPDTRLWEQAMLGLRTSEGVDEQRVLPVLDQEARDRLLVQGCLERRYGKLRLNPEFLDVSNSVLSALLTSPTWS